MSEQRRLDVWIVRMNRVYRGVPFTVVVDRVQKGLLLPADKVRPAGTDDWNLLSESPLLVPYLPQPEPFRAEDQSEALEPVEMGMKVKGPRDEDEDDPDMIPLIDISLVLLVFFMMTAGSLIVASTVDTPAAENARVRAIKAKETITVSMTQVRGQVQFFLGDESQQPLSEPELLDAVAQMTGQGSIVEAVVKANPHLAYESVQHLLIGLESRGVKRIEAGVRDKRPEEEQP